MTEATQRTSNTLFIEVTGSGLREVDGLAFPGGMATWRYELKYCWA